MYQTIFLYITVPIICFVFARRARLTDDIKWVILIIVILSLLAGLRAETVGIDTINYTKSFELIVNDQIYYVWGFENTFKAIMLIISKVFKSYTTFLLIMAIITNTCIISRFWDFKNISKFEWIIVVYYAVFYFYSFNIVRQMCAVAIIFWGSRFIEKQRYGLFIVSVLAGYLFHTSALLGLILLFADFLKWNSLKTRQKWFLGIGVLLSPVFSVYILYKMSRYYDYFSNAHNNIGIMLLGKAVFFILSSWRLKQSIVKRETKDISDNYLELVDNLEYTISTVEIYYFIGLLLCQLGYLFPFMERISLYFYIFECVYMGILMKYRSLKSGYPFVFVLLYGYIIISSLSSGGQGQMPYLFFWQ